MIGCCTGDLIKDRQMQVLLVFLHSHSCRFQFFRNRSIVKPTGDDNKWVDKTHSQITKDDAKKYFQWLNQRSPFGNGAYNLDHVLSFMYENKIAVGRKDARRL